jgi:hypothetical protein
MIRLIAVAGFALVVATSAQQPLGGKALAFFLGIAQFYCGAVTSLLAGPTSNWNGSRFSAA